MTPVTQSRSQTESIKQRNAAGSLRSGGAEERFFEESHLQCCWSCCRRAAEEAHTSTVGHPCRPLSEAGASLSLSLGEAVHLELRGCQGHFLPPRFAALGLLSRPRRRGLLPRGTCKVCINLSLWVYVGWDVVMVSNRHNSVTTKGTMFTELSGCIIRGSWCITTACQTSVVEELTTP